MPNLDGEWDARLPGLARLRALTSGAAEIRIAVLDGPVDGAAAERELRPANLALLPSGALDHGTLVASIAAGSLRDPSLGVAPGCTLLSVPIFADGPSGQVVPCSQDEISKE